MNTHSKAIFALLVFSATLALALFNFYVFIDNSTNHAAFNPYFLFLLIVPMVVISLLMIRSSKIWLLPLILSLGLSVNVVAFDTLNIMKEYESWVHSGMPDRPTWSCFHECSN